MQNFILWSGRHFAELTHNSCIEDAKQAEPLDKGKSQKMDSQSGSNKLKESLSCVSKKPVFFTCKELRID